MFASVSTGGGVGLPERGAVLLEADEPEARGLEDGVFGGLAMFRIWAKAGRWGRGGLSESASSCQVTQGNNLRNMEVSKNCEEKMGPKISRLRRIFAGVAALILAQAASPKLHAAEADVALPDGKKTITLVSPAGDKQVVGHVTFTKDGNGATFEVKLDAPEFQEEFLSMRPFPCLAGKKETWCHLAYPYDMKKRITASDLVDLEYALLFLFKPPAGYGIDPWNGLYFKLALAKDGALSGPVNDVNLDPLGVPPADRSARIIQASDLNPADPSTHRFSSVEIK